jgi:hypothetical protein
MLGPVRSRQVTAVGLSSAVVGNSNERRHRADQRCEGVEFVMTGSDQQRDPDDPEYGSMSVEDDPEGTTDPADLAGTATPADADVGEGPSISAADDTSG